MNHDPYAQKNPHSSNDPYARQDPYAKKSPNNSGPQKRGSSFLLFIFLAAGLGILIGLR